MQWFRLCFEDIMLGWASSLLTNLLCLQCFRVTVTDYYFYKQGFCLWLSCLDFSMIHWLVVVVFWAALQCYQRHPWMCLLGIEEYCSLVVLFSYSLWKGDSAGFFTICFLLVPHLPQDPGWEELWTCLKVFVYQGEGGTVMGSHWSASGALRLPLWEGFDFLWDIARTPSLSLPWLPVYSAGHFLWQSLWAAIPPWCVTKWALVWMVWLWSTLLWDCLFIALDSISNSKGQQLVLLTGLRPKLASNQYRALTG